jgi:hypothetical protein
MVIGSITSELRPVSSDIEASLMKMPIPAIA